MDGPLLFDTFRVEYRTRQYARSYVPFVSTGWRHMRSLPGALKLKPDSKFPMGEISLERDLEISDEEAIVKGRGRKVRSANKKPGINETRPNKYARKVAPVSTVEITKVTPAEVPSLPSAEVIDTLGIASLPLVAVLPLDAPSAPLMMSCKPPQDIKEEASDIQVVEHYRAGEAVAGFYPLHYPVGAASDRFVQGFSAAMLLLQNQAERGGGGGLSRPWSRGRGRGRSGGSMWNSRRASHGRGRGWNDRSGYVGRGGEGYVADGGYSRGYGSGGYGGGGRGGGGGGYGGSREGGGGRDDAAYGDGGDGGYRRGNGGGGRGDAAYGEGGDGGYRRGNGGGGRGDVAYGEGGGAYSNLDENEFHSW